MSENKIIYTKTDEAPALATYSLLPIIKSFLKKANITVEIRDISLAARVLANFPEYLDKAQQVNDDVKILSQLIKSPTANIIKLPNISASTPQLIAMINELQSNGFKIPDYPVKPKNSHEKEIKNRYETVLGSAVNPVLRDGNSDRRVSEAVKQFARNHPHSMGGWSQDSRSHVACMSDHDFYANEQSIIVNNTTKISIQLISDDGKVQTLKEGLHCDAGEIIDSSYMDYQELTDFFDTQIQDAKKKDVLFSLHLKATMMKVSDPIMFGLAVKVYFKDLFKHFEKELNEIGFNPNDGFGTLDEKIKQLPDHIQMNIRSKIQEIYEKQPNLAMVDSDKGITNLHVPSDVIIDASMPAAIRASGKMWDKAGKLSDMKAVIPDRSYAKIYQAVIDFCKENGAFNVKTMGSVANVGLMAKKAEEYGSHDKTFQIPFSGSVRVVDSNNNILMSHSVNKDDIWRMCQTKEEAVKDWVRLGIERVKKTGDQAIFWLDEKRAHDQNLIKKVKSYINSQAQEANICIESPEKAALITMEVIQSGKNIISITGNVLRDYLTDLFPILELGTSAKMLSIVQLLSGGGLYETGAGGSAPRHVSQFLKENHLRWDSLGEFLALAVSLEDIAFKSNNREAKTLSGCLSKAISKWLDNNKAPSKSVGELDTRGSHFYLALYWAERIAHQTDDLELQKEFTILFDYLVSNEKDIADEFLSVQGKSVDPKGYYYPNNKIVSELMCPSVLFNKGLSLV